MRARRIGGLVALGSLAASLAVLVPVAPAGAVSEPEVVAEGLNNPYKLSFGPDGTLYVAEAGTGDPEADNCVEIPEDEGGGDMCVGSTGSVTAVDLEAGTQSRVVEGLPSMAPSEAEGNGAIGPVDVEVGVDSGLYVTVGLGGSPETRAPFGDEGAHLGTVVRADPITDVQTLFADLAQWEADNDPDADQPESEGVDSNPFDLEPVPGGWLAVDAGGNDVLSISPVGGVTLVAVLPWGEAEAPPFIGAPPGTMLPVQPVPTSIATGSLGTMVGQLTGFPFPVGAANVFELDGETLTVAEDGFSAIVDIAQGADGSLYVLEFAATGLLEAEMSGQPPVSRLTQVRPDGTRKILLQDELFLSNGVAVGPDGLVYVSNGSQIAGGGTVIAVDPTVASDEAAAPACDPVDVPGAEFPDVGGSVHREAIDCVAWWGLVQGLADGTFGVSASVVRGQAVSIVARLMEQAGVELPTNPPDAFSDDEGNAHEGALNALAALGVVNGAGDGTVRPNEVLSRAAVAAFLARAYEAITGDELPAGEDAFDDDDGTVLEPEINAVAAAGWVAGTGEGTFNPSGPTGRSQLASMVARMLGTLVTEGHATPPAAG